MPNYTHSAINNCCYIIFTCEALLFTYLNKPAFYIIGVICLLLTLGLCNVFKFNLFSFKPLKRNEVALIIISFLVIEITTYLLTTFSYTK